MIVEQAAEDRKRGQRTHGDPGCPWAALHRGIDCGIVVTRRGKPVAKLVPAGPGFDRAKARRAVAGLPEVSRGVTLGGLKIRDLIEEGRS
jgi:hypothetical protein